MRYQSAVLITNNFADLKEFYMRVMSLPVIFDFGRCVLFEGGLSVWQLESTDPAARAFSGARAGANAGLELCFETEEFDKDADSVMARGVRLLHQIEEEAWGQRTIRFFDPDGNLIELGESIPCFCLRLYKQGLSLNEVAQKTGVCPEQIRQYISV